MRSYSAFRLRPSFPLNLYENFFREHQYGLATQSFAPWFREQLLGLALTLVGGTLLVVVLYAVFRRAPRTWWIWATIVMLIFSGTLVLIAPVYIEPLFNTYKPITDPKIRDPILVMARANEIPVKQVFEVDASRQTTRVSANVSGLLGTTRVALNDNLLKQCTSGNSRGDGARDGALRPQSWRKTAHLPLILILIGSRLLDLFDAAVKRWGEEMVRARYC
jgi:STE24 endopeptidase